MWYNYPAHAKISIVVVYTVPLLGPTNIECAKPVGLCIGAINPDFVRLDLGPDQEAVSRALPHLRPLANRL